MAGFQKPLLKIDETGLMFDGAVRLADADRHGRMKKHIGLLGALLVTLKLSLMPTFAHTESENASGSSKWSTVAISPADISHKITEEQARALAANALYGADGPLNHGNFDYQGANSELSPIFYEY